MRSMMYQQGFDHGLSLAVALLRGETGEACTIVIPSGISHGDRHHFLEGVADGIRNIAYSATLHILDPKPEGDAGQMLCIYAKNQKMLLAEKWEQILQLRKLRNIFENTYGERGGTACHSKKQSTAHRNSGSLRQIVSFAN